jgi:hypothetical protein
VNKKIAIFFSLSVLIVQSSFAVALERASYDLVPTLDSGFLHIELSQADTIDRSNVEMNKAALIIDDLAEKRGVGIKKYGPVWRWGDEFIISVLYEKAGKEIRWRESISIATNDSNSSPKVYDQLFELGYLSIIENKKIDSTDIRKAKKDYFTTQLIWAEAESKKTDISENPIKWSLGLQKINDRLTMKSGKWGVDVDAKPLSIGLTKLLNRFTSSAYDYSTDVEYCGKLCRSEDYLYYRNVYRDGDQKSLLLTSFKDLTGYINSWEEVNIVGSVTAGDRGIVYLQPKIKYLKKESDFDGKFPIVAFSFIDKDGEPLVIPAIKNDADHLLLTNRHLLNSLRLNWVDR